jgi:hypothetical protein
MYMLPLPPNVWASSYLPVNAGLRALGRLAGAEWLVNPALSAFSIVAVWAIGRRLWPERPALALIAAALMATSPQLIVMSMSAYAMPAHLAFNLAWLWLFLRGGKLGHAGAIVLGFFATGIHQLIFHPLFVAPFVLQLWLDRRWSLAALYTVAYGAIGIFWIEYWPLAQWLAGVHPDPATSTGGSYMIDRIADVLGNVYWRNVGVFGQNLFRFATWQNALVAPLALLGGIYAVRAKGTLRALALGIVFTLAVVFIATPTQTHGWGYRYMHGLLGSTALLAAFAWAQLTDALTPSRKAAAMNALAVACALSLAILTPLRTWQAWAYVRPYAAAEAGIQASGADVVVIDHNSDVLFDMGTLTRNDPFLAHGPKIMAMASMDEDQLRELCAAHPNLAIFNGRTAVSYGIDVVKWDIDPDIAKLRALMGQLHCGKVMLRQT